MQDMKQNHVIVRTMLLFIVLGILLVIISGCIENVQSNSTTVHTLPPASPAPLQTATLTTTTGSHPQNQTLINPITIVTTVTPHFTGTITYGSNRSSALTEDQAWNYAAAYMNTMGIQNIQPMDIEPLGQNIYSYKNGTQTLGWGFKVHHTLPTGGRYEEGIIDVDAYDGHVLYFAPSD